MHTVLHDLSRTTQVFLENILPDCDPNWWDACVVSRLTFQQQRLLTEKGYSTLSELDLASLLRVFDQNWFNINQINRLQPEVRNWLKEAQSVRNRWAHLPPGGLIKEDEFRDLDTVWRLLSALGADEETLERARTARDSTVQNKPVNAPDALPSQEVSCQTLFSKGSIVRLKARPDQQGVVVDILEGADAIRYQIFQDGRIVTFFETQIESINAKPMKKQVTPETLHASLTSLQLQHPSTSHLYSLYSSRINLIPYQFRPVMKLIQSDRPRILIADEVGVGKTIEAGLILKELQARSDIRSVLVICPKPLVAERKWMNEMKRFDEQFTHIDGPGLRYCIEETHMDGVWPQSYAKAIIPYSLFDESTLMGSSSGRSHKRGLLDLDPPPAFDLVIVDEAHHIRNTDTWAYKTVRYFCDNAEAVVLLSATPIQLEGNDLFTLLHLLRPDVLVTSKDFERMSKPNPHINHAIQMARQAKENWIEETRNAIQAALNTEWGRGVLAPDSRMQDVIDMLAETAIDTTARLTLIQRLENLYTFSSLINRTRRRDIGNFTTRLPKTVEVKFTEEQAELHDDLLALISRMIQHRHEDINLKFMTSTLRRQLSSCVYGLAPLMESILGWHVSLIELYEAGAERDPEAIAAILEEYQADITQIIHKANALTGEDPKFNAFIKIIQDKQRLPNNKILVFSTFRHTLSYLERRLSNETIRISMIHGDIPDDERRNLRNRFSLPKDSPEAIDILLSSEVGCEGLDYQFCDSLINYDLPWNPMRIEQRIGRIDRYGQKSETVVIYNFITPGTVDAEIYQRCLLRIGVFQQALGGNEAILGRITRELRDIAEDLTLSTVEREERLQQLADNEIKALQVQAELEEKESEFFGLQAVREDNEMIRNASSFWLSPFMLANLIGQYLLDLEPGKTNRLLDKNPVKTLQLNQATRSVLLRDAQSVGTQGTVGQAWERWLKGSDSNLTLTFDPLVADEERNLIFITPTHPLAKQAAMHMDTTNSLRCCFSTASDAVDPGRYPFAIYRWSRIGLKDDFTFQPISLSPESSNAILQLLETAQEDESVSPIHQNEEEVLEGIHFRVWTDQRAIHIERVEQLAQARLNSLATSHAGRIELLVEQRDNATEARIRRMRDSQIESARRDFERRVKELEQAASTGDILAQAVTFGVIQVNGKSQNA